MTTESSPSTITDPATHQGDPTASDTGLILTTSAATTAAGVSRRPAAGTELVTTHGRTTIADAAVARIVGLAARDVAGVSGLARSTNQALTAVTRRLPGGRTSSSAGVSVEVGERRAAVDLAIVADYGAPIATVTRSIRENVITTVERMTGLEVTEVNINVTDLGLPRPEAARSAPLPGPQRRVH